MVTLSAWYRQCPKPHRYGTAQHCYTSGIDILNILLRVIAATSYQRTVLLKEMSASVDRLKIFLRLAKDTGALSQQHYIQLEHHLHDIGKQIGGWLNALQTKRPTHPPEPFCEK